MKVAERDYVPIKDKDDCNSMKSLNIFGDQKKNKEKKDNILDKEKDICDTISAKSFKSHKSGISLTSNFMVADYISEEPSLEYDDEENDEDVDEEDIEIEEEVEKTRCYNQLELKKRKLDAELYLLTAQLSPWLDRFGRVLVDLSPHIAMFGHKVHPRNTNNLSILSVMTNEGSLFSERNNSARNNPDVQYPPQLERYLNPQNINRARFRNAPYRRPPSDQDNLRNTLQAPNAFINFEIPVMLNPGEIVSLCPRPNPQIPDVPVHLHVRAEVPIERRDLLSLQSRSPARRDRAIQTEHLPHFSHVATISERNGSDFDLGSFRGSMIDRDDKDKRLISLNQVSGGLRSTNLRAASHIAVEENENEERDMRDITFRPSELMSDFSLNNSPDNLPTRIRPRDAGIFKRNSILDPREGHMEGSEMSGEDSRGHIDSPGSISRIPSKTVCFKINETEEKEDTITKPKNPSSGIDSQKESSKKSQ